MVGPAERTDLAAAARRCGRASTLATTLFRRSTQLAVPAWRSRRTTVAGGVSAAVLFFRGAVRPATRVARRRLGRDEHVVTRTTTYGRQRSVGTVTTVRSEVRRSTRISGCFQPASTRALARCCLTYSTIRRRHRRRGAPTRRARARPPVGPLGRQSIGKRARLHDTHPARPAERRPQGAGP